MSFVHLGVIWDSALIRQPITPSQTSLHATLFFCFCRSWDKKASFLGNIRILILFVQAQNYLVHHPFLILHEQHSAIRDLTTLFEFIFGLIQWGNYWLCSHVGSGGNTNVGLPLFRIQQEAMWKTMIQTEGSSIRRQCNAYATSTYLKLSFMGNADVMPRHLR